MMNLNIFVINIICLGEIKTTTLADDVSTMQSLIIVDTGLSDHVEILQDRVRLDLPAKFFYVSYFCDIVNRRVLGAKVVIERIGYDTLCRLSSQTYFFGITIKALR